MGKISWMKCFWLATPAQVTRHVFWLIWHPKTLFTALIGLECTTGSNFKFGFLINPVSKIFPHTNEYVFTIGTVNKGSKSNILTFQGPNQNIFGIACLLSVVLITDSTVKHLLISKGKLPDHLLWMAKIFNCSDFLRCVMIK